MRSLSRPPVLPAAAVFPIALGIGVASTLHAAFGVWLPRPRPLPETHRGLVRRLNPAVAVFGVETLNEPIADTARGQGATLLASYLPARRGSTADPVRALSAE